MNSDRAPSRKTSQSSGITPTSVCLYPALNSTTPPSSRCARPRPERPSSGRSYQSSGDQPLSAEIRSPAAVGRSRLSPCCSRQSATRTSANEHPRLTYRDRTDGAFCPFLPSHKPHRFCDSSIPNSVEFEGIEVGTAYACRWNPIVTKCSFPRAESAHGSTSRRLRSSSRRSASRSGKYS